MTQRDTFTGDGTWTVPDGVEEIVLELRGENGDENDGFFEARGGYVEGELDVSPSQTFHIINAPGGGDEGGDGAAVALGSDDFDDIVAAVGGGGEKGSRGGDGGAGGGLEGEDGEDGDDRSGGEGGTQTEGGSSGDADSEDGDQLTGGAGNLEGGDGGGGYYGGGGGGGPPSFGSGGGGGGGSSYIDGLDTVEANEQGSSESRSHGSGSEVAIVYEVRPESPQNLSTTDIEDGIEVTWDGDPRDGEYRLFRDTDASVDEDSTLVETISSGTSHTVTDSPAPGDTYYYAVASYTQSEGYVELTGPTDGINVPVQPPTDVEFAVLGTREVDISWTLQSEPEGGVRVYLNGVADDLKREVFDLPPGTESITDTSDSVPDGRELTATVEVYSDSDSAESDPSNADTTPLLDESQPTLDNGVKDEITVDRDGQPSNAGDVRYQLRKTGENSWDSTAAGFDVVVESFDAETVVFDGLLDGEEYEVRGRTETTDVTGAWTEPVAIITKFPGAAGLSATAVDTTSVTLEWTEHADNEDGQLIIREKARPDGSWGRERIVADAGVDTETFVDDTAQPDTEYRYRIRAFTEFAEADSDPITVETDDIGLRRVRVPPSGPKVLIETASGQEIEPRILDVEDATGIVNELPRLTITVSASERWDGLEGQPARAWRDGVRLPIDEVASIDRGPERYELELRGGSQLDQYAEGVDVEFIEELSHVAAGEVIDNFTDYASTVDDPESEQRADVPFQSADNEPSFEDVIVDYPFDETEPVELGTLGELETLDVGVFEAATDMAGDGQLNGEDVPEDWPDGEVIQLGTFEERRMSFSLDYDIPEDEAFIDWVFAWNGDNPEIVLEFDEGNTGSFDELETFPEGSLSDPGSIFSFARRTELLNFDTTLEADTHRVRFRTRGGGDADIYLGWAFVYDDRFAFDRPTDVSDGIVTGHQQRPDEVDVRFEAISSIEQVVGGTLDVETDATDGLTLGVRNDIDDAFTTASGTDRLEATFDEPGQLLQAQVTLGRYDSSGDAPGTFGDRSPVVSAFDLFASLDDTPVVLDKSYRGSIEEILNRIRESGDFVWAVVWDDSLETDDPDGGISIEWTTPGQREATRDLDLVDWSARTSTEDRSQRAIVYGANRTVRDERFTANDPGLAIGLDEAHIEPGSETVTDPDTDEEFSRGIDYEMRYADGGIAITSGGDMSEGEEYAIEYDFETRGEYTLPGVEDPDTIRVEAPEASTAREAEQLALGVVKRVSEPLEEVDFQLAPGDLPAGVSLVDVLSGDLPFDTPIRIKEVDWSPEAITGRSVSRQRASEIVEELRDRLDATSRRV